MKNKIIIILVVVIICYSGCENMPGDYIPDTFDSSVHLILSTEKKSCRLYINSVISVDDITGDYLSKGSITKKTFIHLAKVTINDFLFTEVINEQEDYYYYRLEKPGFIQAGTEYNLLIITEKGKITGKTKVPEPFTFMSHPKESYIKYTGENRKVHVEWKNSSDASGYIYMIKYPTQSHIINDTTYYYWGTSDPNITHDTTFTFDIESKYITSEKNKYTIYVWAFDDNYENYYVKAQKSSGLNGSFGVFGSMVLDSIVINVTKQ